MVIQDAHDRVHKGIFLEKQVVCRLFILLELLFHGLEQRVITVLILCDASELQIGELEQGFQVFDGGTAIDLVHIGVHAPEYFNFLPSRACFNSALL